MMRSIGGVAAGLVAWIVVVTLGNVALRGAMPGYGEAEAALRVAPAGDATATPVTFTLAMLVARLLLGAASSVAAGATTAWIARGECPRVVDPGNPARRAFHPGARLDVGEVSALVPRGLPRLAAAVHAAGRGARDPGSAAESSASGDRLEQRRDESPD